ncbi:endonuclease/exonuclease/phosphatase family protein [Aeromicrobium sp. CnD17-E]|uniref:endonuclease/exonuclease/phosphatase family protein n=1 Tax=Aeromicrobium sp. CnD17-E TaxID=2954487 RepID=UPI0020969917|nr:endonuclease/exonuclease/phosphatase family protein [Aeromicrobium sp. CnD17-E]MCO7238440.1 endonuclease/exonuclease/phosphatase family protein [Aeromicrobium sp. CnD17-E]
MFTDPGSTRADADRETGPMIRGNRLVAALALVLVGTVLAVPATSSPADARDERGRPEPTVRVATFNASLNRPAAGDLRRDLSTPSNAQARAVAEIVQRTRPDVLVLQELDHDPEALRRFQRNYLERGQQGADPVYYRYTFTAPVNTGVPTGLDLNGDGRTDGPDDAYGFGAFPGQYGMAVLSRYPIDAKHVRTFQKLLWKDMPGNRMPQGYYSPDAVDVLRLSSKSHWDVPVKVGRRSVHLLVSHPTPPVFDGPEDRNGRRNADEIRFWADYTGPAREARWIRDDRGRPGGLQRGASFVIAGDLNSDPVDGDSLPGATNQLLDLRRVNTSLTPSSAGAVEAARLQGGANLSHRGDPQFDTADFSEPPGNIRADYVLPSADLDIRDAQVFWPVQADPLSRLTGTYPFPASDHRLVWVDLRRPPR